MVNHIPLENKQHAITPTYDTTDKDTSASSSYIDISTHDLLSEKSITIILGNKILIYKKNLQSKPVILIPASESEKDRNELAALYPQLKTMPTKMLDVRMYNFLLLMQRKRDLKFFQDHSTPQHRVQRLALFMLRLATPIIFLNHKHTVLFTFPEKNINHSVLTDEITQRADFNDFSEDWNGFLSQEEFFEYRNNLKIKLSSKNEWKKNELNVLLSHLECDLLSQILSTSDELLMFVKQNDTITFVDPNVSTRTKKDDSTPTFAYCFEPDFQK